MAKTWVVVAESARARFFSTEHANGPLMELADMSHPESRQHSRDISSDLPGAGFDGTNGGQHAYDSRHDPHQQEHDLFAREVAERLEQARIAGEFESLRISAPPTFLGALRHHLSPEVQKMVIRELDKDLVRETEDSILAHLF